MPSRPSTEKNPNQALAPEEATDPDQVEAVREKAQAEPAGPGEVKYTGDAGVREITKAQWKGAGVENQDTVLWNAENDYTVPSNQFTPEALEVLKRDSHLKIK